MSSVAPDGSELPDATLDGWYAYQTVETREVGANGEQQLITFDHKRWVGKSYDATHSPVWDDSFQKWDQWHRDTYGITIDRKWSADDGTTAAKLAIDTDYIQSVSDYNAHFNAKVLVDVRYLGANVQPNSYTPKPEWSGYLKPMLPMVGIMLAFAGIPLLIGDAALGLAGIEAGSMPLAAQAVGNMAVSTAMNGGDISKAATGALTGMIASGAGDYIGTATASAEIGKAASLVTQSAISGKSISGISLVTTALDITGAATQKVAQMDEYTDFFGGMDPTTIVQDMQITDNTDLVTVQSVYDSYDITASDYPALENDIAKQMADAYNASITKAVADVQSGNSSIDLSKLTIKDANSFLRDASILLTTVKALKNGTPIPYAGTSIPVGVPQLQPDGSYKINNGNGTVTTRYPTGVTQTLPITSSTGLSTLLSGNMPLYIGGAALALLLLRK